MVLEPRTMNGGGGVGFSLVPCSKSNGIEDTSNNVNNARNGQKTDGCLVNGVRTYKRRRNSRSSSEDDLKESLKMGLNSDGQLKEGVVMGLNADCQLKEKVCAKDKMDTVSYGLCTNEQSKFKVLTEPCQLVSHDAIVTEKYDMLWQLLSENFQGIKIDAFSDYKVINTRMKDGSYNRCPQLFFDDIRQLGLKFQKVGAEVVSIAKGLSDGSRALCSEKAGGSINGTCLDEKHTNIDRAHPGDVNFSRLDTRKHHPSTDSDHHCQSDHTDSDKICMSCRGKTKDRSIIVCDSCEKIYHIYCVGVSVTEGSPRAWCCNNCVSTGSETPHENCAVCERASTPLTGTRLGENLMDATANDILASTEEESNHSVEADVTSKGTPRLRCKICKCEILNGCYRECEHYSCYNKFHLRCLTELQMKRFGPHWYCSSCLCRVCLIDRDDEQIVLCDGCDNAYHIYCMEPPRSSVPEGEWFCRVCETKLRAIHHAKMLYENHHGKGTVLNSLGVLSEAKMVYMDNGNADDGGLELKNIENLDMLLSAAQKLKEQEKSGQQQVSIVDIPQK